MSDSYICACCGQQHEGTAISFASDYPDNYAKMSDDERDTRAVISSDQCIIDGNEFWLRGCLEIPIHDQDNPFIWGVWANLYPEDFDVITDHWETEGREKLIGPFKGRLGNSLSLYTETANLKLTIQIRPAGTRPLFVIDDQEHPLWREQIEGISLDKAREYSCLLMKMAA
jgi:hypothetical protein